MVKGVGSQPQFDLRNWLNESLANEPGLPGRETPPRYLREVIAGVLHDRGIVANRDTLWAMLIGFYVGKLFERHGIRRV